MHFIIPAAKMVLITFLLLSTIVIICDGLYVLGSSSPLTVQIGDSVLLPCSVETPIALDELEVEWRKTDHDTLVHLFQDGQVQSESQDQDYLDRAHFFPQDIPHGNFSLLLSSVTSKDAGIYKCIVHTNRESGETLIELKLSERLNVSVGHAVFVYVGEETTLNCSVDTHIPFEMIEEVSWKRKDDDISVLLYQEGSVLPEATHERYRDRVEFFSAEERQKGNFSLKLKHVRTEDKGLYVCQAFSGEFSANGTVEILQLGISNMHIAVLILCLVALVVTLLLTWPTCMSLMRSDYNNGDLKKQYILVFFPNIVLAVAFIFWGVIEGTVPESVTCPTLNILRILMLFWFASYPYSFPGNIRQVIKEYAVLLEILIITIVTYSVAVWQSYIPISGKGFLTLFIILAAISLFCSFYKERYKNMFVEGSNCGRMLLVSMWNLVLNGRPDFFATLVPSVLSLGLTTMKFPSLLVQALVLILVITNASLSVFLHLMLKDTENAFATVTIYLYMLTGVTYFDYLLCVESNRKHTRTQRSQGSNSSQIRTQPSQRFDFRVTKAKHLSVLHTIVYMFGAVGLIFVNSVALATELILKARNGERTADLRFILLPFESLFAMGCLFLLMASHWRKNKTLFKTQLRNPKLCFSWHGPRDSMAQNDELERLPPEERVTTSVPK